MTTADRIRLRPGQSGRRARPARGAGHYAAAGNYDPDQLPRQAGWGLETDSDNRRLRRHHYTVHYSTTRVDVSIFTGVTIAPDQTVVGTVSARPEILA